jgi:dihydrofolate synthase / folylpolyglutamate synthase
MKPGLERTIELLRRLGEPQRGCGRVLHITGTSGKGSVAALAEAALRAAGRRTGLYTSPDLGQITERIRLDGEPIAPADFARLVGRAGQAAGQMVGAGHEQPTEFEVLTAAAFRYYHEAGTEWLVLEVGLGGRFDATTAVHSPAATAITNIGLDHVQQLGPTHEAIAWDKAGILKPGVRCVTATAHPGALAVIEQVAAEVGAPLHPIGPDSAQVVRFGPEGQVVNLKGPDGWLQEVRLSLLGRHQAENAALALWLLTWAGVGEEAVRQGFASAVWPGRFELVEGILLDGAHSEAKAQALSGALADYYPGRPLVLVLGLLADKNVPAIVGILAPLARHVVVTTPASPRAMPAAALAKAVRAAGAEVTVLPAIPDALEQARRLSRPDNLIVVTGSFYTVGPARAYLKRNAHA